MAIAGKYLPWDLIMEQSSGHHLNFLLPVMGCRERHYIAYVIFLPRIFYLNLIIRKQSFKSILKDDLQNKCARLLKSYQFHKRPEKGWECFRLKDDKETCQVNPMCEP